MKKFIICACCIFLSGAGAQAVTIINQSVINATAVVSFYASAAPLGPNGEKTSKLDIKIRGVEWVDPLSKKSIKICHDVGDGFSLTSNIKVILMDMYNHERNACRVIPG